MKAPKSRSEAPASATVVTVQWMCRGIGALLLVGAVGKLMASSRFCQVIEVAPILRLLKPDVSCMGAIAAEAVVGAALQLPGWYRLKGATAAVLVAALWTFHGTVLEENCGCMGALDPTTNGMVTKVVLALMTVGGVLCLVLCILRSETPTPWGGAPVTWCLVDCVALGIATSALVVGGVGMLGVGAESRSPLRGMSIAHSSVANEGGRDVVIVSIVNEEPGMVTDIEVYAVCECITHIAPKSVPQLLPGESVVVEIGIDRHAVRPGVTPTVVAHYTLGAMRRKSALAFWERSER